MTKYIISRELLEKFPTTCLGIIPVRKIDNAKSTAGILRHLRNAESKIKNKFQNIKLSVHPRIKCWRGVYSAFGAKPSKYNCSIEAMIKRILEGDEVPDINDIVNLYNYVSLKNLISVGGDDADKIEGNVTLTLAKGDERFREIGQDEIKNPNAGEAIFKDGNDVLGRRWNWRQSEKTKITKDSKNINLQIEAVHPVTRKDIETAGNELIGLIQNFFNVEPVLSCIDKENTSVLVN